LLFLEDEEDLGSSEESGKDWDELEEEARRGMYTVNIKYIFMPLKGGILKWQCPSVCPHLHNIYV
jgi:hypothetical protein